MPIFELKPEESKEVSKATFDKKDDYIVVTLKNDPLKANHMVHKIHGEALVKKGLATQVKDAKLEEREVENTVIKEPKNK